MFDILLSIHIVIAFVMGFVAAQSVTTILLGRTDGLFKKAKSLSALLFAEAFTGVGLGLTSPDFSPAQFCVNIALYLSAFTLVELAILLTLRRKNILTFPYRYAFASFSTTVVAAFFVLLVRVPLFY